jgi:AcrR family transcriptional regulator
MTRGVGPPPPAAPGRTTRDTREFPQQRARETHLALLSAALEVFADKGYDDAQTPDIARAAGVSVGTFYRYFADKHQAFVEAITAHLESVHERVMKNLTVDVFRPTLTPEERRAAIDHVIDLVFQIVAEQPRLQRVFIAMALRDPVIMEIRTEFAQRAAAGVAALITQVAPPGRILDPEAAAQVIQIAAEEVAIVTMGGRGPAQSPERVRALRSALAEMFLRYVFGE